MAPEALSDLELLTLVVGRVSAAKLYLGGQKSLRTLLYDDPLVVGGDLAMSFAERGIL